MSKVDLYLGSDIGLWVLQQISAESVGQIITIDSTIKCIAESNGFRVLEGNANKLLFNPSTIGLSIHYPRILHQSLLSQYTKAYNLHPGYLPWGKCYFPVFWALWEDSPAGATLHEMTSEVDSGPIVDQIQVDYFSCDTGDSLFNRVREAEKVLFLKYWPQILVQKNFNSTPQLQGGTWHSKNEFFMKKRPKNWEEMSGKDIVKLARCLTFNGYSGLELSVEGKIFTVHLSVEENKNA